MKTLISDIELIIELGEGLGEVVYTFINKWKKDKSEGHILLLFQSLQVMDKICTQI